MREHFFVLEEEKPSKSATFQHARQPAGIVLPHFVIGNRIKGSPKWNRFVGLNGHSRIIGRKKNATMQAIAIHELEMELTSEFGGQGFDAEFLASFAHRGFEDGFAGLNATTGAIDLTRSQSALFTDE